MDYLIQSKKPYVSFKDYVGKVEENIRRIRMAVNYKG